MWERSPETCAPSCSLIVFLSTEMPPESHRSAVYARRMNRETVQLRRIESADDLAAATGSHVSSATGRPTDPGRARDRDHGRGRPSGQVLDELLEPEGGSTSRMSIGEADRSRRPEAPDRHHRRDQAHVREADGPRPRRRPGDRPETDRRCAGARLQERLSRERILHASGTALYRSVGFVSSAPTPGREFQGSR